MGRSGGYQTRIGNKRQTTLDAWLAVMQFDAGHQLDLSILDAAAEVVDTLHTRRRGLRGSLRRMGNAMGDIGWPLEQLNTWIAELSILSSRSHRMELRSFESATALAEGWAERYVRGAHSGACIDAVTGVGTPTALRMRLKEIFQHCKTFDITPNEAYCFVVIDADTDDLAPFERDAVMITTAGVVVEVFQHGETVVRHRGRVIVLASKSEATRHWTTMLTEALQAAPITRSADLAVWTDELPESTIDLDRHLRDLVG
jgi:GGDEF domain-containing protein